MLDVREERGRDVGPGGERSERKPRVAAELPYSLAESEVADSVKVQPWFDILLNVTWTTYTLSTYLRGGRLVTTRNQDRDDFGFPYASNDGSRTVITRASSRRSRIFDPTRFPSTRW